MLISFDLEGTLVDGELFQELGKRLGNERRLSELTQSAMVGNIPLEQALEMRTKLINGVSIQFVKKVADSIPLIEGAEETIHAVKLMGYIPSILSGGFDLLALRVAHTLGIKYVLCNRFRINDGVVNGFEVPLVTPEIKADYQKKLADLLGFQYRKCIAVGDGANDIPMLKSAGLGIAFNGRDKVRKAAHVVVEGLNLTEILPCIPRLSCEKID